MTCIDAPPSHYLSQIINEVKKKRSSVHSNPSWRSHHSITQVCIPNGSYTANVHERVN